jgi:DNA-binding CsgD family transcriptional regulator
MSDRSFRGFQPEARDLLYAIADQSIWPRALDRVAQACGGVAAAVLPYPIRTPDPFFWSLRMVDWLAAYRAEHWVDRDPVLRILMGLNGWPDGGFLNEDSIGHRMNPRDPYFDRRRCFGLGNFAAYRLDMKRLRPVVLFVVSSPEKGFARGDLEVQGEIVPEVGRALLTSMELADLRRAGGTLANALGLKRPPADEDHDAGPRRPDAGRRNGTEDAVARLAERGLSPAEAKTAALVGSGESTQAISRRLRIKESTVRFYLKMCYSKLGVRSQTQLALLVSRLGE